MTNITQNNYRGRQMDPIRSQKIADATWKLLASHGYDALTFDAIAGEVGCNRATIYRRHSSKVELVTAVLQETLLSYEPVIDDTMSPRDALFELVMTGVIYMAGGRGMAVLNVITVSRRLPELANIIDILHDTIAPYYFAQFRRLIPEVDVPVMDFAMRSLIGSMLYHLGIHHADISRSQVTSMVDAAIEFISSQHRLNAGIQKPYSRAISDQS